MSLHSLEEMFAVPQTDPFEEVPTVDVGMDQLRAALAAGRGTPDRVVIRLPKGMTGEDAEARLGRAVQRYCARKVELSTRELAALRRRGLTALRAGLVLLAVCLSLSAAVAGLTDLPTALDRLLTEGLVIAGWVALWNPVDVLVYQQMVARRDRQAHELLGRLPVRLEADPDLTVASPGAVRGQPG